MSLYPNDGYPSVAGRANPYNYAGDFDFSAVLRQTYLWLAAGLLICFGVAYGLGQAAAQGIADGQFKGAAALLFNPVSLILALLIYLGLGFTFYPIVRRASPAVGGVLFVVFAIVFGYLIADIFIIYTPASIARTFLVTAAMFGVMSLIGYTTKLDLSRFGALFLIALIGLIVASIVNIFLGNSVLNWIITFVGVLIFTGLIAYDTQWLKRNAASIASAGSSNAVARIALVGAFRLMLDFVNLFLFLLRIFGRRR